MLDTPPTKTGYPRGKRPTIKKYGGEKGIAQLFLTNIELYFLHYRVYKRIAKIIATSMHLKDKPARWIQPIMDDYLANLTRMRTDIA